MSPMAGSQWSIADNITAHTTHRTLSRTFDRCEYMKEIYQHWVRGKKSIVALTDNSAVFKTKFAEFVKAASGGECRISTMRWAKHRHESMVRPLGRSVLNISAQMELAAWIATTRHGKEEAKIAKSWLEWMNEERYIQACMMADGGDEVMMLLRYMDNEEMPVEESMERVWLLKKHLYFLFGPERGCTKVGGYTHDGLRDVQRARFFVARGRVCKFGGPSVDVDGIVGRCLARMQTWLVAQLAQFGVRGFWSRHRRRGERGAVARFGQQRAGVLLAFGDAVVVFVRESWPCRRASGPRVLRKRSWSTR